MMISTPVTVLGKLNHRGGDTVSSSQFTSMPGSVADRLLKTVADSSMGT